MYCNMILIDIYYYTVLCCNTCIILYCTVLQCIVCIIQYLNVVSGYSTPSTLGITWLSYQDSVYLGYLHYYQYVLEYLYSCGPAQPNDPLGNRVANGSLG